MNVLNWLLAHRELVALFGVILLNLCALGYNLFCMCKNGKAKEWRNWIELIRAARQYEIEAQGLFGVDGAERLNYVLDRLRSLTAELGCAFEEEKLIAMITEDIDFGNVIGSQRKSEGGGETG